MKSYLGLVIPKWLKYSVSYIDVTKSLNKIEQEDKRDRKIDFISRWDLCEVCMITLNRKSDLVAYIPYCIRAGILTVPELELQKSELILEPGVKILKNLVEGTEYFGASNE